MKRSNTATSKRPNRPPKPRRSTEASPVESGAPSPATQEARPLDEIIEDLKRPIPKRLLKTKTLQGQEITYCPWYRVQKILDHYTAGRWEYEVVERTLTPPGDRSPGRIMLTVRISIHTAEGVFHREGTGIEDLDVDGYGDPQSNAESMAFRRAAAKWGLGIDLYEGDAS